MRGFTLLEVIIVGSIFTIGFVGVLTLIAQNIAVSALTSNQQIALYLAQEGLELTKNIADTNDIRENPWDQGLNCAGDCEADYTSEALVAGNRFLLLDGNNLYNYSGGTESAFVRKIVVHDASPYKKEVTVTVSWAGGETPIVLDSELYKYVRPDPRYEYMVQEISPF